MSSYVVIDASLAVFSVLNTPQSPLAARAMEHLALSGFQPCAPGLWWYEVTSVIHRYYFGEQISDSTAHAALNLLTVGMGVQLVDAPVHAAFDWASRLGQKAAYDGFYLAAAEKLSAQLWTADQALNNNTRQIGITWVHWMGDIST